MIVDEQHRFGVLQRLRLMQKGRWPDSLVMTATPIPRTLALTLYGELDVSVIDQLPPGRQPILTRHVPNSRTAEVYELVRKQAAAGRQAYIVYPLVEESEKADLKSVLVGQGKLGWRSALSLSGSPFGEHPLERGRHRSSVFGGKGRWCMNRCKRAR